MANSELSSPEADETVSDMIQRLRKVIRGRGVENEGRLWIKLLRVGLARAANNGALDPDQNGASGRGKQTSVRDGGPSGRDANGALDGSNGAFDSTNGALARTNGALANTNGALDSTNGALGYGALILGELLRLHGGEGEECAGDTLSGDVISALDQGLGAFVSLCVVLANRCNAFFLFLSFSLLFFPCRGTHQPVQRALSVWCAPTGARGHAVRDSLGRVTCSPWRTNVRCAGEQAQQQHTRVQT